MVLGDFINTITNILGLNKQNTLKKPKISSTVVNFPQGAQLLKYNIDKNINGVPYMIMSNRAPSESDMSNYINAMNNKKKNLQEIINDGMGNNLDIIESFKGGKCVDRDYEYFRELSRNMRDKQLVENKIHYCLTGINTHLVESNSLDTNNLSYNNHLKSIVNTAKPWELEDIHNKILPEKLYNLKFISNREKNCLNNN